MPEPPTIAVFTKNQVNPAYAGARLAADRVAAESGARTVHFVPATPDDVGQQKALVTEALKLQPDAVVFVPVDDDAMVEDGERFAAAGIPVALCINRMPGRFVTFVGSDDVAVGESAAKALFDELGGRGRIVALSGTPAAPTSRDRVTGLGKALARCPGVVLLESAAGYYQQDAASLAMAGLLARWDRIDGVWTANDVMAFGALEALDDAARTAKVVGVNGLAAAIDMIETGRLLATVDFSAFNIAALATRAALRHLHGEAVPTSIMVPAALIDRSNYHAWQVPLAERPCPRWEEFVS